MYLLVVVLLAGGVFLLLEKGKKTVRQSPEKKPRTAAVETAQRAPSRSAAVKTDGRVTAEKQVLKEEPGEADKQPPVQKKYTTHPVAPPVGKAAEAPLGSGTVAIIIDDMGKSTAEVRELMAIGVPLTFAVIPGLGQAEQVARVAHGSGYQVMLHIPMEPKDYPRKRLESNGLLLAQDNAAIEGRMAGYLRQVPHAVGANNHMGSRFTEDREKMRTVLGVLKGKGLFFVDSMTTSGSVGIPLSRELGVRTVSRNVFIDNSDNVPAIKAQLGTLARMAAKRGSAVGICHPHRATIRALAEELPALQSRGIRFVYVSHLVR